MFRRESVGGVFDSDDEGLGVPSHFGMEVQVFRPNQQSRMYWLNPEQ